jgi:ribonuclease G
VIVRTAAVGKTEEDFRADLIFLTRLWERISNRGKIVRAPRMIHSEEPLVFRTIRDMFTRTFPV